VLGAGVFLTQATPHVSVAKTSRYPGCNYFDIKISGRFWRNVAQAILRGMNDVLCLVQAFFPQYSILQWQK
jgi:hypothetical protein